MSHNRIVVLPRKTPEFRIQFLQEGKLITRGQGNKVATKLTLTSWTVLYMCKNSAPIASSPQPGKVVQQYCVSNHGQASCKLCMFHCILHSLARSSFYLPIYKLQSSKKTNNPIPFVSRTQVKLLWRALMRLQVLTMTREFLMISRRNPSTPENLSGVVFTWF